MNRNDLEKRLVDVEAEAAAIKTLLSRFDEPRIQLSSTVVTGNRKRPTLMAEEIIKKWPGSFFPYNIGAALSVECGRKSHHHFAIARQIIHKLRRRGQIETLEEGKGSRSGEYRYVGLPGLVSVP